MNTRSRREFPLAQVCWNQLLRTYRDRRAVTTKVRSSEKMKWLIVAIFSATVCLCSAWGAKKYTQDECKSYDNALQDIDGYMEDESRKHGFNFYNVPRYYTSRVQHALRKMNEKIRNPPYPGRQLGQCKPLEDAIKAKNFEYGIEVQGLEDGVTRFNKLLNFLNERNQHQFSETDRQQNLQQQMGVQITNLEQQLQDANETIARMNHTIHGHQSSYKILQEEYHKILAKLHKNSPAIRGKNGTVTGLELSTRAPETLTLVPVSASAADNNSTMEVSNSTAPDSASTEFKPDLRMNESEAENNATNPVETESQ